MRKVNLQKRTAFWILLISIGLLSSYNCQAQNLDNGTTWTYLGPSSFFPTFETVERRLELVGDTLLSNRQYKIMEGNCTCSLEKANYIRWEGNKIYNHVGNEDAILYDFDLRAGDSYVVKFERYLTVADSFDIVVDSLLVIIDSTATFQDSLIVQHVKIDLSNPAYSYMDWSGRFVQNYGSIDWCFLPQEPLCEIGTFPLCSVTYSDGQSFYPNTVACQRRDRSFAPLNAEWYYEGYSYECLPNHQYFKVGSELQIEDKLCTVINSFRPSSNNTFDKQVDSLIVWQLKDQVYFYQDSNFYLMYDFGLDVGDTLISYHPLDKGLFSSECAGFPNMTRYAYSNVILQIDTLVINGQKRKEFKTQFDVDDDEILDHWSYIEGIGSTSQVFAGDACFYLAAGCFGGLRCYSNESLGPVNFNGDDWNCFSSSTTNILEEVQIAVYPNPVQNQLNILVEQGSKVVSAVLYGLDGESFDLTYSSKVVDLSQFNSGIYFLKITTDEGYVTKKIIKE